jgi:hypothetical protein
MARAAELGEESEIALEEERSCSCSAAFVDCFVENLLKMQSVVATACPGTFQDDFRLVAKAVWKRGLNS